MKLLLISTWFPYPPINGAKIRKHNIVRQLSKFAEVDLISLTQTLNPEQLQEGINYLQNYCRSVQAVPAIHYRNEQKNLTIKKLFNSIPDSVLAAKNPDFERRIAETWRSDTYDAAIVTECGSPHLSTFTAVSQSIRPLLVDSVELGVFRPKGPLLSLNHFRQWLTWYKACRFSSILLRQADIFTVTSKPEYALFQSIVGKDIPCEIVSNVVDLGDYEGDFGPRDRASLIHCGSFSYPVNYDAVVWFAQNVFGKIKNRDAIEFRVTGRTANRDLTPISSACPQVEFTGLVKDIRPYIARSRASLVPVLAGGSTRLKILESMALGTPIVSTRLGAEGIEARHGEHILLADSPEEFAQYVDRLIEDDELWHRLSVNGRQLIEHKYSAETMGEKFKVILNRLSQHTVEPVATLI